MKGLPKFVWTGVCSLQFDWGQTQVLVFPKWLRGRKEATNVMGVRPSSGFFHPLLYHIREDTAPQRSLGLQEPTSSLSLNHCYPSYYSPILKTETSAHIVWDKYNKMLNISLESYGWSLLNQSVSLRFLQMSLSPQAVLTYRLSCVKHFGGSC